MKLQDLCQEKVVANIKIGTKAGKKYPTKLSHFHVEKDKLTDQDMVDIFKQKYPNEPKNLSIMFTSEKPITIRFVRYANNKPACIGNGKEAITCGKDDKGNMTQIKIPCNEECAQYQSGKCKVKCSLRFKLDGIEAGGLWNLSTSSMTSARNLASELYESKQKGLNIAGVPFELKVSECDIPGYPTYYLLDLKRKDLKPKLVESFFTSALEKPETLAIEGQTISKEIENNDSNENNKEITVETQIQNNPTLENNVLNQESKSNVLEMKTVKIEEVKNENAISKTKSTTKTQSKTVNKQKEETSKDKDINKDNNNQNSTQEKENIANYYCLKEKKKTQLNNMEFDEIILQDSNKKEFSYILHPKASKEILDYGIGSLIEINKTMKELDRDVICLYTIKQKITEETNNEELKKAV